jgi:hypothetical protein
MKNGEVGLSRFFCRILEKTLGEGQFGVDKGYKLVFSLESSNVLN